ncbi:hypothetical protein ACI8AC_17175 [Geodermatophilus sp. SYSU D00758]
MLGNSQHPATPDRSADVVTRPRTARRRALQGVTVGAFSVALALGGQSVAQADDHRDGRGDGHWRSWSSGQAAAAPAPAPAPAPAAAPAAAPAVAPVAADLVGAPTATSTAYSAWAPHVRPVVAEVAQTFGVSTVYTRPGHSPTQELAADFMVYSDSASGDAIAQYVLDNADRFNVEYVIWKQRIHMAGGSGWRAMEDRGSATANHMDHVHVSFTP